MRLWAQRASKCIYHQPTPSVSSAHKDLKLFGKQTLLFLNAGLRLKVDSFYLLTNGFWSFLFPIKEKIQASLINERQSLSLWIQTRATRFLHWGTVWLQQCSAAILAGLQKQESGPTNAASTHMCPEESANCENGGEDTHELMTDKPPPLDAIYRNHKNVPKCISCQANAWVHQVKNKLHILAW